MQTEIDKLVKQATELRNGGHGLEAAKIYKKAAKLADGNHNDVQAAECIHMAGVSYKVNNDKTHSMKCYEEAVERFARLNRLDKVGSVQRDIGIMLAYHKEYNAALKWLHKSERVLVKNNNLNELGITQAKIGLMYIYLKDYNLAEKELKKGLHTIESDVRPHNFYIMTTFLHLAVLEIVKKNYNLALKYANEAYDLLYQVETEEGGMDRRRSQILGIRAQAYFGLRQIDDATQDVLESLKLLEDVTDEAAAVVYEDIEAAKLLNLIKINNPESYKQATLSLNVNRIERLSAK